MGNAIYTKGKEYLLDPQLLRCCDGEMTKQAVVLAGGKGTRLAPLTNNIPKPMVPVNGRPFLEWQLSFLRSQGIERVVLMVSHLAHIIKEHFAKSPMEGLNISFSEEPSPMGTGGALKHALPLLEERFWLFNGDSFLSIQLQDIGEPPLMICVRHSLVGVPGNVQVEGDLIIEYVKTGRSDFPLVDAGVYLLNRSMVEQGPTGVFDMGEFWPPLIKSKQLKASVVDQKYYDIGTLERLKVFEREIVQFFPVDGGHKKVK